MDTTPVNKPWAGGFGQQEPGKPVEPDDAVVPAPPPAPAPAPAKAADAKGP